MQVTDSSGNIFGPNGLQVNGSDGKPKVISSGGGGGSIPHGTASGTDTYTVAITGVTSYADGDAYLVRFTNGNTTGSTLNINGLGAIQMYRNNDGQLIGGDIQSGAEMLCVYNSTLNVFQVIGTSPNTLLAYVTNAEAITITKGQPVYAFGGQGDRLKVKLAYNTSDATSAQTVGLVLSTSIGANQKGFIILNGQLDGLSILPTSTWADGDPVYLGATPGSITNIKPHAPNHLVYLGFVTTANNGSAGRMYVRVQNGYELDELHDVQISGLADNDLLQYDLATDLWQNKSLSGAGIQPTLSLTTTGTSGAATLVGSTLNIPQYGGGLTVGTTAIASGTIGRVLFQGTGNVLQQSANLFWDNTNGRLGIGTATPSATLHSVGSITASGAIARGNYMQPTLVAAANNDVMVGLDIAPTFTNGAFTGVTNASIRATNGTTSYAILSTGGAEEIATEQIAAKFTTSTTAKELAIGLVNLSGKYWKLRSLSDGTFDLRNITDSRTTFSSTSTGNISIWGNTFFNNNSNSITNTGGINGLWLQKAGSYTTSNYSICSDSTATFINAVGGGIFFRNNNSSQALIASTGNFLIGTTTDAGFKLDVNGTARVSGALTFNGGTGATKTISEGATYGLLLWGGTGSNADLTLTDRSGNLRFRIVNGANILQTATTINDVLIGGTSFASKSIYTSGTYGFVFGGYSGTSYHISLFESTGTNGLFVDSAGRAKVGAYNSAFNNSAILEAVSTTQGFLPPRMTTTQKNAIATPAAGLVVYDTTLNKLCVRTASAWETITSL